MKAKSLLLAALAVLIVCQSADACSRCRRYGRSCVYYRAPYVAPVVAVAQTPVYVVQNNYPAPMVGQGTASYVSNGGIQSAMLPYLDPNQFASQRFQLLQAFNQTGAMELQSLNAWGTRQMELQAPIAERYAAGAAASAVLTAAGLNPTATAQNSQSTAVVINRDTYGRVQVVPLTPDQTSQLNQRFSETYQGQAGQYQNGNGQQYQPGGPGQAMQGAQPLAQPNQGPEPQQQNTDIVTHFCGECHGRNVAQPPKGLYLVNDPSVMLDIKQRYYLIHASIEHGTMPLAKAANQPNAQERKEIDAKILSWILASEAPANSPTAKE